MPNRRSRPHLWKHPRFIEVLGKHITDEIQENKDRLERFEIYHNALQSIKAAVDNYKSNNFACAFPIWEGAKNTAHEIFGSWNFMDDLDENNIIASARDLKSKIVEKFSEGII